MRTAGKLFTCDRCGKKHFEDHSDSDMPIGWNYENFLRADLCPDCSNELDKQLKFFLNMNQYELELTPYTKEVIENDRIS